MTRMVTSFRVERHLLTDNALFAAFGASLISAAFART